MYNETYTIKIMKKEKTINTDVIWPIRMTKEFKIQYKEYCDNKGYSFNKRIKTLMDNDMNNKIKI